MRTRVPSRGGTLKLGGGWPQEPVGTRQVEHDGKLWPPYPRPIGPEQPCAHIYHAEHYWPWPYICTDRQVVLDMSRIQEANGWLSETTLYDYHFNAETNELTVPGKLQLKWILENVPPSYRTVWLQQAEDQAVSQQRMVNVRAVASRFVSQTNLPAIAFRPTTAPGRPAVEVDHIRRKELESIPNPRIAFEAGAGREQHGRRRRQPEPLIAESTPVPRRTFSPDGDSCREHAARSGNAFS